MKKYIAIMLLCLVAFVNASYLTYRSYWLSITPASQREVSFCDINSTFSCTDVLDNPYSRVFGIPFPAIAMAVYPVLFILAFLGYRKRSYKYFMALLPLAIGGTLFNSFFIYREATIIGAYCYLCLICTGIIVTIALISGSGFCALKREKIFAKTA